MRAALARVWAARLDWRGMARGMALLVSGVAWISYGASIASQPRYGTVRGISVLLDLAPMTAWGWGWVGFGIIAIVYSAVPTGKDLIGLGAAMAPPMLWALAYALGGATGAYSQAWGSVAPWASHAALLLIIAYLTRPRLTVVTHGFE